jgi:anti-sigma factor RsiW
LIRASCQGIDRPRPRQAGFESPFRYPEEDDPGLFYWSGERFGCVIAAKADDDLVLRIAESTSRYPRLVPKARLPPAPGKDS